MIVSITSYCKKVVLRLREMLAKENKSQDIAGCDDNDYNGNCDTLTSLYNIDDFFMSTHQDLERDLLYLDLDHEGDLDFLLRELDLDLDLLDLDLLLPSEKYHKFINA